MANGKRYVDSRYALKLRPPRSQVQRELYHLIHVVCMSVSFSLQGSFAKCTSQACKNLALSIQRTFPCWHCIYSPHVIPGIEHFLLAQSLPSAQFQATWVLDRKH